MTLEKAKEILDKNAFCKESSLRESLCEDSLFSEKLFWEFYDSIIALAEDAQKNGKTVDDTAKILGVFNRITQIFMYHFDPNDICKIENFPENYTEYFERLEFAVRAYLCGEIPNENGFALQRPEGFDQCQ